VDVVSGGAITQACLYALLRMGARGDLRVFEPETLDGSNLNRYALSRRSDVPAAKTEVLAALSTDALRISGVPLRVDPNTIAALDPRLRPAVLVGVGHIPSRWPCSARPPAAG
jgi:molybdopterin/thiamine biosynthesis adenylyltransferase